MAISSQTRDTLFRVGYTTKGILYSLIGTFAVATVFGEANGAGGPKAIIKWIGTNPFGQILLGLMGVGLLFYSLYRIYTGINPPDEGKKKFEKLRHVAWVVSGISYGVLAFFTFRLLFMGGSGGGSGTKQSAISWLLQQSWGPVVVGIIGGVIAATGFFQFYKALKDKHMEPLKDGKLDRKKKETFKQTGRVGLTSRAVIFGIIAYFLFRAAWMDDPSQFKGVGESLSYLRGEAYGPYLLAIVGAGLLAYGLFMFVRARYERSA